ncbi:MAG: hypothetical protein GY811_06765 [Myxococcales bacterium]|nr:hypothetical protein [Myxococcales bacterium]
MNRWLLIVMLVSMILGCGAKQPDTDESLVDRVCVHAMQVAKKEEIGEFTMDQCRTELRKRSEVLRAGFRGWANCLLNMDSIVEAKLNCRESDFMNPS